MSLTLTGAPLLLALFVLAMMLFAANGTASSLGAWAQRTIAWISFVSIVVTLVVAILALVHFR